MTDAKPISGPELQQLKQIRLEEDERNGGVSDTTRCILEIERLLSALDSYDPTTKIEKHFAEHHYTKHEIDAKFETLREIVWNLSNAVPEGPSRRAAWKGVEKLSRPSDRP